MSALYVCQNSRRRALVLQQGLLNGIDFLEVLDSEAAALGSPPQQTLLVHLLRPGAVLSPVNFVIAGGVRIAGIACVWAYPANATPSPPANPAEAAYFSGLQDAAQIYVVRTSAYGDYSTYSLDIVGAGGDAAPAGFDPRLCSVDFSFKVERPSPFDCQTSAVAPPPAQSGPLINYLARDFATFRQLMLDRMSATAPAWQERNVADLGIALVEVLAYAADHLSYFQDAVATEAYLGTARKRISVRRHAVLLGYSMHTGCNARVWVFLETEAGVDKVQVPGPGPQPGGVPGTRLLSQTVYPTGFFNADQMQQAIDQGALVFETMADIVAYGAHNRIRFYTWSDDQCCLPVGAASATLRDDGAAPLQLNVGDALLIEEVLSQLTGQAADADPAHRCVVRLTSVSPAVDPFNGVKLVEIAWASGDALTFAVALSASIGSGAGAEVVEDLSVARGNMVLADCGLTIASEPLSPATTPAVGPYRPQLQNPNVSFATAYDDVLARANPVDGLTTQDPRAALPEISLSAGRDLWTPAPDLLESSAFERNFVVETETDGSATLRFGDGVLGALPVSNLISTYRTGNGSAGNLGAGAITNIPLAGFASVRNPLPAAGGVDPETSDQVRASAPQAFRGQLRAVTAADCATLAATFPGVRQAQATRRWTGSWTTMSVTADMSAANSGEAALATFLEPYRLAGYDLALEPAIYVPLQIAFTVNVAANYQQSAVELALFDAFSDGVRANGQKGFFHPDNWSFGQTLHLSQVIGAAMATPGVLWVNFNDVAPRQTLFQRWGRAASGELAAGEIDFARLEIARLDNDPSTPENGVIQFYMQGGL